MKKVLYIATSDIHLHVFHRPYIQWLSENGAEVDLVFENRGGHIFPEAKNIFHIDFPRSVLQKSLQGSYKNLKEIISRGPYDIIHCHTPIPSLLTRLAARKARKKGSIVMYTVHGFHFYKGAPLTRWLVHYPVEYLLSYYTDATITINHEDNFYAEDKMLNKDSWYIKGVGADPCRFKPLTNDERAEIRKHFGWKENDFILIYVAEFIPRKNHEFIIRAVPSLMKKINNLKVVFAGRGILLEKMKQLSEQLSVQDCIEFLGFRNDVHELFPLADVAISSSRQEGLPINMVEAMMCGLPVVANEIRGHTDLVKSGKTGFLYKSDRQDEFVDYLHRLASDPQLRNQMGAMALERSGLFTLSNSLKSMKKIYTNYLAG